jgi:hypothetical protein
MASPFVLLYVGTHMERPTVLGGLANTYISIYPVPKKVINEA